VLLYEAGNDVSEAKREMIDASGKLLGTLGDQAPSRWERVSPDGKRVAYSLIDANSGKADIWIHDIASGNRTRLTVDPVSSEYPAWSRDGEQIAFVSTRSGKYVVYLKPANGMGVEKKVWEAALVGILGDWTLDGKALIVDDRSPASGKSRLVLVPTDGQGQPSTLLEVEGANVYDPRLSADGRWLAYESDESGKYEVYVSAFPKPAGSLQISLAGGGIPTWRRDGKELYYAAPDGNLMAAELNESNGSLQVASRRALFPLKAGFAAYDAFPDGKKFLVDTITKEETPTPLSLVSNWTAELKLRK
jgi:eukaryotic-like serine/threonine-protein kinase